MTTPPEPGFHKLPRRPSVHGNARVTRVLQSGPGLKFDGIAPQRESRGGRVAGDAADFWLSLNDPDYLGKRRKF